MVDPLMLLARLAIALSPAPLYGPQIWKVRRSAQDGFSTFTCLTLLVSSILRCFFWLGRRFDDALLVQALLTIFVQLLLLDAIVALRSKKHGQRHFFGGGGGGGGGHHAAASDAGHRGAAASPPRVALPRTVSAVWARHAPLAVREFWQWDEFAR